MQKPIEKSRRTFNKGNGNLKRARRLYYRLIRGAIAKDRTEKTLHECAIRMIESGLRAPCSVKYDVQHAILRAMWRLDTPRPNGLWPNWIASWLEWCEANGWNAGYMPNGNITRKSPETAYEQNKKRQRKKIENNALH